MSPDPFNQISIETVGNREVFSCEPSDLLTSSRPVSGEQQGKHDPVSMLIACAIVAFLFALAIVLSLQPTHATPSPPTFTVNSNSDVVAATPLDNGICETAPGNGVCTLRAAIMKANHYPGGGVTINFGLPGVVTYKLTIPPSSLDDEATGDLNISSTMTIVGNGAANTIIDGNATDRVILIDP